MCSAFLYYVAFNTRRESNFTECHSTGWKSCLFMLFMLGKKKNTECAKNMACINFDLPQERKNTIIINVMLFGFMVYVNILISYHVTSTLQLWGHFFPLFTWFSLVQLSTNFYI